MLDVGLLFDKFLTQIGHFVYKAGSNKQAEYFSFVLNTLLDVLSKEADTSMVWSDDKCTRKRLLSSK